MRIVDSRNKVSRMELRQMAVGLFGDPVKAVVDVERGIMAIDAELHSDEAGDPMSIQHRTLAAGRWDLLPFAEQMANVGSEVERTISWRKKGRPDFSERAFERALELLDLTVADRRNRKRLRELLRVREALADFLRSTTSIDPPPNPGSAISAISSWRREGIVRRGIPMFRKARACPSEYCRSEPTNRIPDSRFRIADPGFEIGENGVAVCSQPGSRSRISDLAFRIGGHGRPAKPKPKSGTDYWLFGSILGTTTGFPVRLTLRVWIQRYLPRIRWNVWESGMPLPSPKRQ